MFQFTGASNETGEFAEGNRGPQRRVPLEVSPDLGDDGGVPAGDTVLDISADTRVGQVRRCDDNHSEIGDIHLRV
jgi:hypothetical protein